MRISAGFSASLVALALLPALAQARQFRSVQPIATPAATAMTAAPAAVAAPQSEPQTEPQSREQLEPLVRKALESWNTPEFARQLSPTFYDRERLADSMGTVVPRDAVLRVQSIQGVQTLQQSTEPDPDFPGRTRLVTLVSVTARTQIEYHDPAAGFVKLPGVNEYILRVTQPGSSP